MAHPTDTSRSGGHLWHLEDQNLTAIEAKALAKHLRKTEEKRAKTKRDSKGKWQVWWAKK